MRRLLRLPACTPKRYEIVHTPSGAIRTTQVGSEFERASTGRLYYMVTRRMHTVWLAIDCEQFITRRGQFAVARSCCTRRLMLRAEQIGGAPTSTLTALGRAGEMEQIYRQESAAL